MARSMKILGRYHNKFKAILSYINCGIQGRISNKNCELKFSYLKNKNFQKILYVNVETDKTGETQKEQETFIR